MYQKHLVLAMFERNISKCYGNFLRFELLVLSSERIRVKHCKIRFEMLLLTNNRRPVSGDSKQIRAYSSQITISLEASTLGLPSVTDLGLPFSSLILGILVWILTCVTSFLRGGCYTFKCRVHVLHGEKWRKQCVERSTSVSSYTFFFCNL